MVTKNKIKNIISWLREEVKKAQADGLCVAISGGIDSAVAASLAKLAFPNNSTGLFIDIESSKESFLNFNKIIKQIKIEKEIINLDKSFNQFIDDLNFIKKAEKEVKGNIKSRLRMNTMYAYAKINNYLVVGTSNYSEIYLGYFTKWGDGVADVFPLANFKKSEIYQIAKLLELDEKLINQKPSADLWCGQTDENELGFKYSDLEKYWEDKKSVSLEIRNKIEISNKISNHKRNILLNAFQD